MPIGSWETLRTGTDIAILSVGSMVYPTLKAADKLENDGIYCEVVNCRFIKPMDLKCITSLSKKFHSFLIVEEGVKCGGFGEGVSSILLKVPLPINEPLNTDPSILPKDPVEAALPLTLVDETLSR